MIWRERPDFVAALRFGGDDDKQLGTILARSHAVLDTGRYQAVPTCLHGTDRVKQVYID